MKKKNTDRCLFVDSELVVGSGEHDKCLFTDLELVAASSD